jgi:hypothetical protein
VNNNKSAHAPSYTQKDLEKFQKMFGSGFEPDGLRSPGEDIHISSKRDDRAETKALYSGSDKDKFEQIVPTKTPRKPSAAPAKGGRIGSQKASGVYSSDDLKKFEALEGSAKKSRADQSTASQTKSAKPGERKWRFPELHEPSQSRMNRPEPNGDGQRRVKLRYFD